MNFQERRKDFSIFVFLGSEDISIQLKGLLVTAGYEAFVFNDQEIMLDRIKQASPHVVLFAVDALLGTLSDFVQSVLDINNEIQFVAWAPAQQTEALMEYRDYNLTAHVIEGESRELRSVWAVDQVCEKLYQTYLNEGLIEDLETSEKKIEELGDANIKLAAQSHAAAQAQEQAQSFKLIEQLSVYSKAQSKEEALSIFMQQFSRLTQAEGLSAACVFFKFLPTVQSLVATASSGLDIQQIKGIGAQLKGEESQDLLTALREQRIPQSFAEVLLNALGVKECYARPVSIFNEFDGVLVFWADKSFAFDELENHVALFQLIYQQAHLLKKNQGLDFFDPVTELFNRNYFVKKLEEEGQRSKRLQQSLSLVRVSIDGFKEIESSMGRANRDLILKAVSAILKKTSRVNDICCRTDDNHISIILPHCGKKGASLRAERIRRLIENHSFAMSGLRVTVSCGVSEYPSLVATSAELDASVNHALDFVFSRGGNKVCLFTPAANFKPEFEVPTESSTGG